MNESWLFRQTHQVSGRKRIIDSSNSGLQFLKYSRIVLRGGEEPILIETGKDEVGHICLQGEGEIEAGAQRFRLKKYDALYLPIQGVCRVQSGGFFDLAECAAPASKKYEVQFVPFAGVLQDSRLVNKAGVEPYARTVHTLIGEANVKAARLLTGVTTSKEGNWTSWPPHDHSQVKEEIYLYVDMPAPQFAVHLNYWDFQNTEIVAMVREGDAVAIRKGYHYNVAAPGTATTFLWMMSAIREEQDRVFTQVTVQPEFEGRFKLF